MHGQQHIKKKRIVYLLLHYMFRQTIVSYYTLMCIIVSIYHQYLHAFMNFTLLKQ